MRLPRLLVTGSLAALVSVTACTDKPATSCTDNSACSGSTPVCSAGKCVAAPTAATLALVSGDHQSAAVATAAANPLVVAVTDSSGKPVSGVAVTWATTSGGGSLMSATTSSGTDGTASATAVLGSTLGANTFTASAAGLAGSPVTFTLTATAGSATSFKVVFPTSVTPGVAAAATVSAFDMLQNPTNYSGSVKVTTGITDANAVLPASFALVIPAGGTGLVTGITLAKATSAQAVIVTDVTTASLTGSQPGVTVGPGVTIAGASSTTPRGTVRFSATGGSGAGFTWNIAANGSGGSIDASSGVYTAGDTASSSDVVKVTDSLGNSATATVAAGGGITITGASSVAPRGAVSFSARGGSGTGFSWTLLAGPSGGAIDATSGAYTAGSTGGVTDKVKVTDSLGNLAQVDVTVGPGVTISGPTTTPPRGSATFTASGGSGAGFTWSLTSSPSGGSIDAATGAYVAGASGPATDQLRVVDSLGNVATGHVAVGPGLSINGAGTTSPRGSISFTATGGAGAGLVWSLTASPSGGNINASTGVYTAGPTGNVTDAVRVVDQLGNSATANVNVGAGLGISGATTTPPRGTITFTTTGGGGAVTWSATTPSGGSIVAATGVYTAGSTGGVTDVVRATDAVGGTVTVNVTVTAGVSISGASAVAPHGSATFSAAGGSGTGFGWSITTNASGSTINPTTGAYTAGATPNVSDVVRAVDSLGNSATLSVSVTSSIVITGTSTVVPRGSLSFTASQGSGSGYTWSFATNASGGTINPSTGAYTAGSTGNVTDVVRVTDSLSNTTTFSVAVSAGVSITGAASAAPRQARALSASGGSGTGYAWTLSTNGSGATLDPLTGAYVAGSTGSTTDVARVVDSLGNAATLSIAVGPGVSITGPATAAPGQVITFTASGGSGTGYAWSLSSSGSGGSVNPTTGVYTAGATGSSTDVVRVVDSLGNVATRSVAVGAGITVVGATSVAPRQAVTYVASGGSGSGYVWSVRTNGSGGAINPSTGAYVAGTVGSTTDDLLVMDSLGNSVLVSVSVTAGVSVTGATTAFPRQARALAAVGGSGAGFTWSLATNNSGGTINPASGLYTAGATGGVIDTVQVTDSLGNTATTSITVGAGVSLLGAAATAPRGLRTLTASGGSGTGYVWALSTNASGGAVIGSGTGNATGTYTAGVTGNVTDVVQVTDSLGNTATVSLNVGVGVSISGTASAAPKASVTFLASGGSGTGYTWSLSTNASGGSISAASGLYTAGATGSVSDVVRVVDSLGNVATVTVSVSAGVSISGPTSSSPKGTLTLGASGGSGTGYTWALTTNNSGGSIGAATGLYTAGATGSVSDTVRVIDSLGNTATVSVSVGAGVSITGSAGASPKGSLTLGASGGSGAGYTWALTTNNSGGNIGAATGLYTAGATGSVTDTVQVTDSLGNVASRTVSVGAGVSITGASTAPPKGSLTLGASGGSGTGYTWSLLTNNSGGNVNAASGLYTAGAVGNVTDVVKVIDSLGNFATTNLTVGPGVSLTGAASAPPRGSIVLGGAGGSGVGYVFTLPANNSGGTLVGGVYTAGAVGNVSDQVQVSDSLGNVATRSITVGPGITITGITGAGSTPPKGVLTPGATGGSGVGYVWSVLTNNSGGAFGGGAYVAGSIGNVIDVLKVVDSLGNAATVNITVGPGVSISGATSPTAPNQSRALSAVGGSGVGYAWTLTTNTSGGAIVGGVYTPGPNVGSSDVIRVTDSLGNIATATVLVLLGPTSQFAVSFVSPVTVSVARSVTVTAQDAFGNTTPNHTGTLHFSSNSPGATLPADYSFVVFDLGVHTFTNGVTFSTVNATTSLTVTDVFTSLTGTRSPIDVLPVLSFAGSILINPNVLVAGTSTPGLLKFTLPAPTTGTAATVAMTVTVTSADSGAVISGPTAVTKAGGASFLAADLGTVVSVDPPSTTVTDPTRLYTYSLTATNAAGTTSAPMTTPVTVYSGVASTLARRAGATATFLPAAITKTGRDLVLVAGGCPSFNGNGQWVPDVTHSRTAELYDPKTGMLRGPTGPNAGAQAVAMSYARCGAAAVLANNNKVYIFGGTSAKIEIYDPTTETFQNDLVSALPASPFGARYGLTATLVTGLFPTVNNNKIILAGGTNYTTGVVLNRLELFDPVGGFSTTYGGGVLGAHTSDLSTGRSGHTATLLGKYLYIVGGSPTSGTIDVVDATASPVVGGQVYNTPFTTQVRVGHAAVPLSANTLLVVGGLDGAGAITNATGRSMQVVQADGVGGVANVTPAAACAAVTTNCLNVARARAALVPTSKANTLLLVGGTVAVGGTSSVEDTGTTSVEQLDFSVPTSITATNYATLVTPRTAPQVVNFSPVTGTNSPFLVVGSGGANLAQGAEVLTGP